VTTTTTATNISDAEKSQHKALTPKSNPFAETHTYHSLGNCFSKKTHQDTSLFTTFNFDIKEDLVGDGLALLVGMNTKGMCEKCSHCHLGRRASKTNTTDRTINLPIDVSEQSKKKSSNDFHGGFQRQIILESLLNDLVL
jgi:hypothetical protein